MSQTEQPARPKNENAPTPKLSAHELKEQLWGTLLGIRQNNVMPAEGDAIAAQAREILRTIKVQLQIVGQSKRNVPTDVIDFAEKP